MTRPVKDSVVSDERKRPSTSASCDALAVDRRAEVDDVARAGERRPGLVAEQLLRLPGDCDGGSESMCRSTTPPAIGMRPLLHEPADDGARGDRAAAGLDLDVEALVVAHGEPADAGRGIQPSPSRCS